MSKRLIVPVWTDTHGGYSFGLLCPHTELPPLDDNNGWRHPEMTATQIKLWEWAKQDISEVKKIAGKDPIFVLFVGDATQGTKIPDQYLVSPRMADQLIIARDTLGLWLEEKKVQGMRMVKGTGWHVFQHGSAEITVAEMLKDKYKKDVSAWYHMDLELGGVRFDIAHHGPNTGTRDWLKGNTLRYYIRSIVFDLLKDGQEPPDIILRGHYHDRCIEMLHTHLTERTIKTWGAVCPAYSLFTDDYTKRATRSKAKMTVGTLAIEIIEGRIVEVHDLTHVVDVRKREVLK